MFFALYLLSTELLVVYRYVNGIPLFLLGFLGQISHTCIWKAYILYLSLEVVNAVGPANCHR